MKKIIKIYQSYKEIINYLIFGVLTTIISLLAYYISVYTFLNPLNKLELQMANIISWILSVLFAYFTNRRFVFKSKEKKLKSEFFKFILARLSTLFLDMIIMYTSVSLFHFNDKLMKIVSNVIILIANYVLSKLLVFRESKKE